MSGAAQEPECNDGDIRLAGWSLNIIGGRVEICHEGVWGSMCNQNFGNMEAKVICNQLGFTECE